MGKSDIDINKIVNITVEFMINNSIDDLTNLKMTRSNEKYNIWSQIALKYFENSNFKNVLNIFTWWRRNTAIYKNLVKKKLTNITFQ